MNTLEAILYLVPGAKLRHSLYPEIDYFTVVSYDGNIVHTKGAPLTGRICPFCMATDCTTLSMIDAITLLRDINE